MEENEKAQRNYIRDSQSVPTRSKNSSFPTDLLSLYYSFGYDCCTPNNLTVLNGNVLAYITGSYIHFYNTRTKKITSHKSWGGGGLSTVTANPIENHLAIGERGDNPAIVICNWPSLDILYILNGGARKGFSYLEYSPEGDVLVSQATAPDFYLTLWHWKKSQIFLRAKAYERDVWNVNFSEFFSHQLVSCGASHIKFWNMNETFTGQKLHGELGRFGKTESCDLYCALPLPDGTFASGSRWGNILIWDEGVIKVEVYRIGKLTCHDGEITKILFFNQCLLTTGMDGAVKIWNYEAIEMADPQEEDPFIELEPLFQMDVRFEDDPAHLFYLAKASATANDTIWFAQDRSGAIWSLDVSTSLTATAPKRHFICHSGGVKAIQSSPIDHTFASLGHNGKLFVWSNEQMKILFVKEFQSDGTCLIWLPLSMDPSGKCLVAAFGDGVLRLLSVQHKGIVVLQALKPHKVKVVALAVTETPECNILSSGGVDGTVFLFRIASSSEFPIKLESIGYIETGSPITHLLWNYHLPCNLIVGCSDATIKMYSFNSLLGANMQTTYLINVEPKILPLQKLAADVYIFEKMRNFDRKGIDPRATTTTATLETQMESVETPQGVEDTVSAEPSEDAAFVPDKITFMWISNRCTLWFTAKGFMGGTIFEYNCENFELVRFFDLGVPDSPDAVCCVFSFESDILFLGFSNGYLVAMHQDDSEGDWWRYEINKGFDGAVNQISLSYDDMFLFTCGDDGTVFSFKTSIGFEKKPPYTEYYLPVLVSPDIDGKAALCLEDALKEKNILERKRLGEEYKANILSELSNLQDEYRQIVVDNSKLPDELKLCHEELLLDERIKADMYRMLDEDDCENRQKMARLVEKSQLQLQKLNSYFLDDLKTLSITINGIEITDSVTTFRIRDIDKNIESTLENLKEQMSELERKGRMEGIPLSQETVSEKPAERVNVVETLLKHVSTLGDFTRNHQIMRLYDKYCKRQEAEDARATVWDEFLSKKPNPDHLDPAELLTIETARENLGDHKLKTAAAYKIPKHLQVTTISKTLLLLQAKKAIFDSKLEFNNRVVNMRQRKEQMISNHLKMRDELNELIKIIPADLIKYVPELPVIDTNLEDPERKLEFNEAEERLKRSTRKTYSKSLFSKFSRKSLTTIRALRSFKKDANLETDLYSLELSEILKKASEKEDFESPWQLERQSLKKLNALKRQDELITEMKKDISDFDSEIQSLREEKIKKEAELVFHEIYVLELSREVLILKEFEDEETSKSNTAFDLLKEKEELQKTLKESSFKIDSGLKNIQASEEEIKSLTSKFLSSIAENKYQKFLKHIYKKKYRPPKTEESDSDESSSDESDSESDEEDTRSLDSKEIDLTGFNENICPPDCDKTLYKEAFASRSRRHEVENNISERKKEIEHFRKQYDYSCRQMVSVDKDYSTALMNLQILQKEKQERLNEIDTLVVLRFSQFKNFQNEEDLKDLSKTVVMSGAAITKLYSRVGELQKETRLQKAKHIQNKEHLQRMVVDVRYMTQLIHDKEAEIEQLMYNKFGTKIDLNELEEALLKKLVAEMSSLPQDLDKMLSGQLVVLKNQLRERRETYANSLIQNTERYNVIALLKEEKSRIEKILEKQETATVNPEDSDEILYLGKLENIFKTQAKKLAQLRSKIAIHKYRSYIFSEESKPSAEVVVEKVLPSYIMGLNGRHEEISESLGLELKSIAEDIDEMMGEIEGGFITEFAITRLSSLVSEFTGKIPSSSFEAILANFEEGETLKVKEDPKENIDILLLMGKMSIEIAATITSTLNADGGDGEPEVRAGEDYF